MTIIGVYLPPGNSFHGSDGDVVFNYINVFFINIRMDQTFYCYVEIYFNKRQSSCRLWFCHMINYNF